MHLLNREQVGQNIAYDIFKITVSMESFVMLITL